MLIQHFGVGNTYIHNLWTHIFHTSSLSLVSFSSFCSIALDSASSFFPFNQWACQNVWCARYGAHHTIPQANHTTQCTHSACVWTSSPYLLVFLLQTVPVRIGCLCISPPSAHSPSPPDPVPQPVLPRVVSAQVTNVLNADRTESEFPFCIFINTGAEGNDGQYIQYTQCGEGQLRWVSTMLYVPVSYRTQCTKCTQYCDGN